VPTLPAIANNITPSFYWGHASRWSFNIFSSDADIDSLPPFSSPLFLRLMPLFLRLRHFFDIFDIDYATPLSPAPIIFQQISSRRHFFDEVSSPRSRFSAIDYSAARRHSLRHAIAFAVFAIAGQAAAFAIDSLYIFAFTDFLLSHFAAFASFYFRFLSPTFFFTPPLFLRRFRVFCYFSWLIPPAAITPPFAAIDTLHCITFFGLAPLFSDIFRHCRFHAFRSLISFRRFRQISLFSFPPITLADAAEYFQADIRVSPFSCHWIFARLFSPCHCAFSLYAAFRRDEWFSPPSWLASFSPPAVPADFRFMLSLFFIIFAICFFRVAFRQRVFFAFAAVFFIAIILRPD